MAATGIEGMIPYAVNFTIVASAAIYFGRKPLAKFVFQRHERAKNLVESAADTQREAKKRFEKVMRSIENSLEEVQTLLNESEAGAKAEAKEILEKAEADVAKVKADAEKIVEYERNGQLESLKQRVISRALDQAEVELHKDMNDDFHSTALKRAKTQIEANA